MPTINFPSGPSTNDTYNLGLRTWKWNGEAWALQPLTGGFTGSQGAIGYTGSAGAGGSSGAIGYTGSQGVFNTDTNVPSLSIDNINIDNNSITAVASNIEQVSYTSVTNNLILNSNIFSTSTWSNTGQTLSQNSAVAPDGTTTADTLAGNGDDENGSNTNKAFWRDGAYTNVNTTYVLSIHAKPKDSNFLNISVRADGSNTAAAIFNVGTGAVVHTKTFGTGMTATSSIVSAGNGWYRCIIVVGVNSANSNRRVMVGTSSGNASDLTDFGYSSYQNGDSDSVYVWGIQLEEASVVTPFVETGSAVVPTLTNVTRGTSGSTAATASSGATITLGSISTTISANIDATQTTIPLTSDSGVSASGSASIGTSNMDLNLSSSGTGSVKIPGALTVGDTAITGALTVGGTAITAVTVPTISSISPSTIEASTATAVTITGTNFTSIPQVEALNSSTGIWYPADSIAFTNSTTIVATFSLSVNASYKLRVENPDGNAVLSSSALLSVSAAPTFSTSAGSLGSLAGNFSGTVATLAGSSDSAIAFSETTNVLTNSGQANCTLNSSTGAITTTDLGGSSTTPTTYNFTVRITDAESQTVDRSFSITTSYGATGGAQFN